MKLGANLVLKSDKEEIEHQLQELAKTEKISAFLDAVGGDLTSAVIKNISNNGIILHYGLYSDENVEYHSSDVIFRNLTIKGFGIDGWLRTKTKTELKNIWNQIIGEAIKDNFKMEVS